MSLVPLVSGTKAWNWPYNVYLRSNPTMDRSVAANICNLNGAMLQLVVPADVVVK